MGASLSWQALALQGRPRRQSPLLPVMTWWISPPLAAKLPLKSTFLWASIRKHSRPVYLICIYPKSPFTSKSDCMSKGRSRLALLASSSQSDTVNLSMVVYLCCTNLYHVLYSSIARFQASESMPTPPACSGIHMELVLHRQLFPLQSEPSWIKNKYLSSSAPNRHLRMLSSALPNELRA